MASLPRVKAPAEGARVCTSASLGPRAQSADILSSFATGVGNRNSAGVWTPDQAKNGPLRGIANPGNTATLSTPRYSIVLTSSLWRRPSSQRPEARFDLPTPSLQE